MYLIAKNHTVDRNLIKIPILLFQILSLTVYLFLLLETRFYKGLILNKLGFSSDILVLAVFFLGAGIISFSIDYLIKNKADFFSIFLKINLYLLPLIFLAYVTLLILEGLNYPNYVLAFFKIDLSGLYYFLIFSLFLSVYYFLVIKNNFLLFKKLCLFLPIVFIAMIYFQTWAWYDFWHLPVEDGPFEYAQFLFYLISTFLVLKISFIFRKINRKIFLFYLFLAFLLFFITMEEVSWGQRILGFETFETIKKINIQNELTIHNLESLKKFLHLSYIIVGLWGSLSYLILPKFKKLKNSLWLRIIAPPYYLFTLFAFVSFYYSYITVLYIFGRFNFHLFPNHGWQEVSELFLSSALLIFFASSYQRFKRLLVKNREKLISFLIK